jgi:NAD+ synthase
MGITYKELDRYLLSGEVTSEVRKKIEGQSASCLHKRSTPPIAEL